MTKYEKYKIYLLGLFVVGLLFCFYKYSQNGRYVFSNKIEGAPLIIDSRTGEIYYYVSREKISIDDFKDKKKK